MELTYDWRSFQSFFEPKRKVSGAPEQESSPVYLVTENDRILSVFVEGEDLSEWVGSTYQELASQITYRELIVFSRDQVDRWMQESLQYPHFYDQNEYLKKNATPQVFARGRFKKSSKPMALKHAVELPVVRHFVLEALQGWWTKVMPSAFGLLIRLEKPSEGGAGTAFGRSEADRELFLIIRRGKIDHFCEPDLSVLGNIRVKQPGDVVKYLSEKYLVPVQGVFIPTTKWNEWSESESPWKQVAAALRGGKNAQVKLVPARWGTSTLIHLRGILGI